MKPCWIFLLSFLFLAGFLPVTAAETEIVITVPSAVEVAGDEMILGELAEITAPPEQREKIARINLGRAPGLAIQLGFTGRMCFTPWSARA